MLLHAQDDPASDRTAELNWHANNRYTVGWKGFLYVPGRLAGHDSIEHLLAGLANEPLPTLCARLRGVFGLFVHDRQHGGWTVLGDNAGLYRLFYDATRVSTSFLDLADAQASPLALIDRKAIIEFIAYGCNFGNHTPLGGIRKLSGHQIIQLSRDAKLQIQEKILPRSASVGESIDSFIMRYFDDLTNAARHQRISLDITGGFDSRVVAAMFQLRNMDFEFAIAGGPNIPDVEIATAIAQLLQRPIYVKAHDISHLEQELDAAFRMGDGLMNMVLLHRNWQMCNARLARSINLMVHGGSGEFFKDNHFIQDFPFYGRAKSDVAKYFKLRFGVVPVPPSHWTAEARKELAELRLATVAKFDTCREATNNKTYDRVFFEYRLPEFYGATLSNYVNQGLLAIAPFADRDVYLVAKEISPWQRTFALWHRQLLTRHFPALAAMRTAEGYTASSKLKDIGLQLGVYARVQAGRVARKLGERYLGKTLFHQVGAIRVNPPNYHRRLRQSDKFGRAVQRLKEQGVLAAGLAPDQIRDQHVGSIMTAGMLLDYLSQDRRADGPVAPRSFAEA